MRVLFIVLFICILIFQVSGTSLWDDKASFIYSRNIRYKVGDTIQILVNENSQSSYQASVNSLKSFSYDISTGELKGIFDFLPVGSITDTQNTRESDSYNFETYIQSKITAIENEILTLEGKKEVFINSRGGVLQITGQVHVKDIDFNTVSSMKLLDSQLQITTILNSINTVLGDNDLIKVLLNPDSTTDTEEVTRISEEKKKEVILEIFNKLLNVIL